MAEIKDEGIPEKIWVEFYPTIPVCGTAFTSKIQRNKDDIEFIPKSLSDRKVAKGFGKGYNEGYGKGYDFANRDTDKKVDEAYNEGYDEASKKYMEGEKIYKAQGKSDKKAESE